MSTAAYVFGKYRYSAASGLRAAGQPVSLGQCPQRCLEVLLAARGALVPKDQLIRSVWHGLASDSSLARSIYLLRQALDDGEAVVATVYGRGYRIAVPVHVSGEQARPTTGTFARGTPAAQEAVLSALEYLGGRRSASLHLARESLQRATALDPTYVAAWAKLAQAWLLLLVRGLAPWPAAGPAIREAIARALALDPDHALSLAIRGTVRAFAERDFAAAWRDLDRAVALDPEYSRIFRLRGQVALAGGQVGRAIDEYDAAIERAPLDGDLAAGRAWTAFLGGRTQDALKALRAAAARWPDVDTVHASLAAVASWAGHHDEAIAAGRRTMEIDGDLPNFATTLAYAYARAGRTEEASALVARIAASPDGPPSPSMLVPVLLALGDRAGAAAHADLARRTDVAWRHTLDVDPRMVELRTFTGTAPHLVLAAASVG
jgi:DNA-binding winged helix-turn-helix (wHTH) protein